ncbi:aldehyde dehydrogenase family protein, partial [Enterobacter hormaechei]
IEEYGAPASRSGGLGSYPAVVIAEAHAALVGFVFFNSAPAPTVHKKPHRVGGLINPWKNH